MTVSDNRTTSTLMIKFSTPNSPFSNRRGPETLIHNRRNQFPPFPCWLSMEMFAEFPSFIKVELMQYASSEHTRSKPTLGKTSIVITFTM